MPYNIHHQGITISCESAAEAAELASLLARHGHSVAPSGRTSANQPPRPNGDGSDEDVQRVRAFIGTLGDNQRMALQAIAAHTRVTDRALFQALNLTHHGDLANRALGGILGAVSRAAVARGLSSDALYGVGGENGAKEYRPTQLLRRVGRELGWAIN